MPAVLHGRIERHRQLRRLPWTVVYDLSITWLVQFSRIDDYLGQYYELQDDTFSLNSTVYVTRSNSSVWLYYSFSAGRWELADRISDVSVVVYGYSSYTDSYDAPPAVSDWTFPAENTTVYGVTFLCTSK